ncbi:hypothetical protein [Methylobacterium frigidaeris]|uniref:Uncharacterized protein n=1 Tax=Methylobacterium frigidaeris TaxID=2038277 RepID=A0AA37HCL9_9HYPH|nr:hypothetical protein [Methylobacterium frigidaeris]PIK71115.1 hypothetical protein CS379_21075 [Methylobacterium frigidaeris]GJD63094.1 hypothetical protein MPEAHAMD_3256 [Methylobacterium frigidaeris]
MTRALAQDAPALHRDRAAPDAVRDDGGIRPSTRSAAGAGLGHLPFAIVLVLAAAPNLLFLATHLASAPLAAGTVALLSAALLLVLRDLARTRAPIDGPLLTAALAAGIGLCLLGGQTHLFFANDDWLIRDAVLRDLVAEPWPVGYLYAGDPTMLRAPLGLYLLPAAIGKVAGLYGAHGALLAQNALLFGCLFYGFARLAPSHRQGLALLAVFVAFSGWDVVGAWKLGGPTTPGIHLEQWLGNLQFSSHVTQLFWVPNHAASGWIFVGAYCLWRASALRASSLAVVFGLCVFWSPLSAIGALPFLIVALLVDRAAGRLTPGAVATVGLAGLGLLPVAIYLGADAGRVPHGFQDMTGEFASRYVLFLTIEIVPALVVLGLGPGSILGADRWTRRETGLVLGLLLLAPLYRLGGADFVMRASIPALALMALRVGTAVPRLHGRSAALAVAILGIGAVTPLYEVTRAMVVPAFSISACNLLAAARTPPNDGPLFHYIARIDALEGRLAGRVLARPGALVRLVPQGPCWPDHPAHQERAGEAF